jgi:tetratricopeptide (TPR) repeat protein
MADIFISYARADREWALWIGEKLAKFGHTPRVAESAVGVDIAAWTEEHLRAADFVVVVVSKNYLANPFASNEIEYVIKNETRAKSDLIRPIFVEAIEAPALLARFKRCDIHGISEKDAEARLIAFVGPTGRPQKRPSFPGSVPIADTRLKHLDFPGRTHGLSNIPISVPRHFLGRENDLAAIALALKSDKGPITITALHGLRGVGKTTLAAVYAERHSSNYRATWWIRAETESTMRADLVGLGAQLGWVSADEKEELALDTTLDRLRHEGQDILLVYDNANSAEKIRKYAPKGGAAHIIVTSNAPNWAGFATPVEIEVWPKEVGANFLIESTGRVQERDAALALSSALGGLPLAHEQAAAYCDRLGIPLAKYCNLFEAAPAKLLDSERDAPVEYHDRTTVTKTFALAIEEAAKLHPAAELLIVYAALLAPEPIPLFLFSEARERFGEPLTSVLEGDGLDEAVAALRAFALVDREVVPDERDPSVTTDCIRLHRLVRQVAAARCEGIAREEALRVLVGVLAAVYPDNVFNDPKTWPRARRLDALALALVGSDAPLPKDAEGAGAYLLNQLAGYRQGPLAAYDLVRPLLERALAVTEMKFGPDHSHTATGLNNLGFILQDQGDLAGARPYFERALAIREKVLGSDHPDTAVSLDNLGGLLHAHGDLADARPYRERALAIREQALGSDHPETAKSLNNLGTLLQAQGDLAGARSYYERALAIREQALGPDHPDTANSLDSLGVLLSLQRKFAMARPNFQRALGIVEKSFGPAHPTTRRIARNLAETLQALGYTQQLKALRKTYGIKN